MARIELAPELVGDFDRILDHLHSFEAENVTSRTGQILAALDVLEHNPFIGRPLENGMRELVIGSRSQGYIALYRHIEEMDTVFVLALKSQREAGFAERE